MAFTVVSGPGVVRPNRGQPQNLGTIAAANNAVEFALAAPREFSLNKIVISCAGNLTGGTFVLEGSIDGTGTWFVIPAQSSDITQTSAPDTAASFAARYDVSGLGAGCHFRFGATALTSGSGAVWLLMA